MQKKQIPKFPIENAQTNLKSEEMANLEAENFSD
jgi:hypothetical protein